jgi:hypothetical protein
MSSKCQYFLLYVITDPFPTDCKHWTSILQTYNPSSLPRTNDGNISVIRHAAWCAAVRSFHNISKKGK